MPPEADKRPHLVLHNTSKAVAFTAHSQGGIRRRNYRRGIDKHMAGRFRDSCKHSDH